MNRITLEETLRSLDSAFRECRLDDAEKILRDGIENAGNCHDTEAEIYLLNELIGFYRDCGRFPESLSAANRAKKLFESNGDTESISYATTLLNCANASRAAGNFDDAFAEYDKVRELYSRLLPETDDRVASFYNNIALLYQETQQWEEACKCLNHALSLVRAQNDETRIAISCSNLAVSLLQLDETDKALKLLKEADEILAGRTPSDFHYSAVLAGFGDAYFHLGDYLKTADYYEKALSEIALHMSRNNFYSIVSEKLEKAYSLAETERPKLNGLQLAKRYYKAFGEPVLNRNFADILPFLAVGLAGEGSDCLGYDDEASHDHDFGAGFCIWADDSLPEEKFTQLCSAFSTLPDEFMGIKRVTTPNAASRTGVFRISDFFCRFTGVSGVPETESQWLDADESLLRAVCSGDIFYDGSGTITKLRRRLNSGYPEAVRLRRLAQQLGLMAQCGQYNYLRMRRRGDFAAAQLYLSDFCKAAMRAAHLCRNVYAPYKKWLLRSTSELDGFDGFTADIRELLTHAPALSADFDESTDCSCILINKICRKIYKEVTGENMCNNEYLGNTAEQLAKKAEETEKHEELVRRIVQLEFQTFDKVQNIGGRAECQDNWETFNIMRSSQYLPWHDELLTRWIAEFEAADSQGRNLITEKYARMMETTDPEKFAGFRDSLPALDDDFIKIREAVISIQTEWMEEFARTYPALAAQARTIHTSDDSEQQTSYETYLRGELSVYTFELLYAYARWITELFRSQKNLSFMIMENTVRFYGYSSLDEAEKAQSKLFKW